MANKAKKIEKQLEKQYKGVKKSNSTVSRASAAYNSMRRTVMARAWKIAKAGSEKYGGKASDYIQTAMKMAWSAQVGGIYTPLKTVAGDANAPSEKDLEEQFGEKAKVVREGYVYMQQIMASLEDYENYTGLVSEGAGIAIQASAATLLHMIKTAVENEANKNGGDYMEAYAAVYDKIKDVIGKRQFEEDMAHLIQATYDDLYSSWAYGGGGQGVAAYKAKIEAISSVLGGEVMMMF